MTMPARVLKTKLLGVLQLHLCTTYTYNHKNESTVRGYTANSTIWKANAVQFVYDEKSHLIGKYNADGAPLVEYV